MLWRLVKDSENCGAMLLIKSPNAPRKGRALKYTIMNTLIIYINYLKLTCPLLAGRDKEGLL